MASCTHYQWVDLTGFDRNWSISYGQRLLKIIEEIPDPDTQFPSTLFFLGKKAKISALQAIFHRNNIKKRREHGIANLQLDVTTSGAVYPLLLADCNPEASYANMIGSWNGCNETNNFYIDTGEAPQPNVRDVVDMIHARLLLPFIDVVCLFADDLGGVDKCVEWLSRIARASLPLKPHSILKPQVLIVTSDLHDPSVSFQTADVPLEDVFAPISFINLVQGSSTLPSASMYLPLHGALLKSVDRAREGRISSHLHFSALHLNAFFSEAVKIFASTPSRPFDFIETAAEQAGKEFSLHLRHFLFLAEENALSWTSIPPFIASAILVDAYPERSPSTSSIYCSPEVQS